jgi:hypothetical protein
VDDLNAFVTSAIGGIVVALAVAWVVLLLAVLLFARRISGLERRLAGLTRGADGQSLEAILDAHLDRVEAVSRQLDALGDRSNTLEATQRLGLQRIGLVRFNPFEDTGGNQSFALAVLDANGDGFVVSSLHARAGTRVYGKSIAGGRSESALSAEESEALRLALGSGAGTTRAG